MKKRMLITFILCIAVFIPVFGQELYTLYCSGDVQGTVTIQKDRGGKITITGSRLIGGIAPSVDITHAICPLIPNLAEKFGYNGFSFLNTTRSIIIDGNTWTRTNSDGSWAKTVVNGNTRTVTHSDGSWQQSVVNGNTTTTTYSSGGWRKTVVNGNTTTETNSAYPDYWVQTVVNGNTETTTYDGGMWTRKVVNGNTTTLTSSYGIWIKTVVDKQGHDIFITTTSS
jgi:hypothetical protein